MDNMLATGDVLLFLKVSFIIVFIILMNVDIFRCCPPKSLSNIASNYKNTRTVYCFKCGCLNNSWDSIVFEKARSK